MHCGACQTGVSIAAGERVGFRDACDHCGADLHVCLNCSHHDRSAYNECREASAERVADRDRANRCEWFRPKDAAVDEAPSPQMKNFDALNAAFKK
jgi:hypothetical protein